MLLFSNITESRKTTIAPPDREIGLNDIGNSGIVNQKNNRRTHSQTRKDIEDETRVVIAKKLVSSPVNNGSSSAACSSRCLLSALTSALITSFILASLARLH